MIRPMRLARSGCADCSRVAGDRAPGPARSSPSASAASATRPAAVTATPGAATTGAALDTLTARAVAVTSPSVVDVVS